MATIATTAQLNAEIAARKGGDTANAVATAALGIRVTTLEGQMANVLLRLAAVEAHFTPPAPPTRPFAAPVTTGSYTMPTGLDQTGIMAFLATVPDGSVVNFPSGATYTITAAIKLGFTGRHNLILDGHGSTIRYASDTGENEDYSLWYDQGNGSHITIQNFVLVGSSTTPGVYVAGKEGQHGVLVQSSQVEVTGCTISGVWGDGLFVEHPSGGQDVWFHGNHVVTAGRNGCSVICGKNVTDEQNAYDVVGYVTIDDEPNSGSQFLTNIIHRNGTAGMWGAEFYALEGSHTGAAVNGITVSGFTVNGKSIKAVLNNGGSVRMLNVAFTGNVGVGNVAGPVLTFEHIDGLTITGNTQPLSSGSLASITDCTGVVGP